MPQGLLLLRQLPRHLRAHRFIVEGRCGAPRAVGLVEEIRRGGEVIGSLKPDVNPERLLESVLKTGLRTG
ncbi:MAG: hypothetical protein AAFY88_29175, partial [Acidobacteriota bacterium]